MHVSPTDSFNAKCITATIDSMVLHALDGSSEHFAVFYVLVTAFWIIYYGESELVSYSDLDMYPDQNPILF